MMAPSGNWQVGIGDPTPIGWLTVGAYVLVAWICWTDFVTARSIQGRRGHAHFWLTLAAILLALGINKQLDLQSALTELGRVIAQSGGWYERRNEVQAYFIAAVAASSIAALAVLSWLLWPLSTSRTLALTGLMFLLGFVLIRASSFHHVDIYINRTALGLKWNWLLELSGIGLVGFGAVIERRTLSSRP